MDAAHQLRLNHNNHLRILRRLDGVGDAARQNNWIVNSVTDLNTPYSHPYRTQNVVKFGDKFLQIYSPVGGGTLKASVYTYTPDSDYTLDTVSRSSLLTVTGASSTYVVADMAAVKLSDDRVFVGGGFYFDGVSNYRNTQCWLITYDPVTDAISGVTTSSLPHGGGVANGVLLPDGRILVYEGTDFIVPGSDHNHMVFGTVSGNSISWVSVFAPTAGTASSPFSLAPLYDGSVVCFVGTTTYYIGTILSNSLTWSTAYYYDEDVLYRPSGGFCRPVTSDGITIYAHWYNVGSVVALKDEYMVKLVYNGSYLTASYLCAPGGDVTTYAGHFYYSGIADNGRLVSMGYDMAKTTKLYLEVIDLQTVMTYGNVIGADLTAIPASLQANLIYNAILSPSLTDFVPAPGPAARFRTHMMSGADISASLETSILLSTAMTYGYSAYADLFTRILLETQADYGTALTAELTTEILLSTALEYGVELTPQLTTQILLATGLDYGTEIFHLLRIPVPHDVEALFVVQKAQRELTIKTKAPT